MQPGVMQVDVFTDPRKFARAARPALAQDPAACNVIATQARGAIDARLRGDDQLYLLIRDGDRPVGVAMHTPPHSLFVGPVAPADLEVAAVVLTEKVAGRPIPGVTGDSPIAYAVARVWTGQSGQAWTLRMDETLYGITSPVPAPAIPGRYREAHAEERPWLMRWLADFHAQIHPWKPAAGGAKRADRTMLLWVTGTEELPVSLAGLTAPQFGVSRIGPVYTPQAFRGRGYARALTTAATNRALAAGAERVVLYADKANPTSNGVYRRIGYRPISEAVLIGFG